MFISFCVCETEETEKRTWLADALSEGSDRWKCFFFFALLSVVRVEKLSCGFFSKLTHITAVCGDICIYDNGIYVCVCVVCITNYGPKEKKSVSHTDHRRVVNYALVSSNKITDEYS